MQNDAASHAGIVSRRGALRAQSTPLRDLATFAEATLGHGPGKCGRQARRSNSEVPGLGSVAEAPDLINHTSYKDLNSSRAVLVQILKKVTAIFLGCQLSGRELRIRRICVCDCVTAG